MTNAEKFKEVFGYNGEDFSSEYYCPFNSEICGSKTCRDCIREWWQSEYKEPKKVVGVMSNQDAIKIFNTLLFFKKVDCTEEELMDLCRVSINALEKQDKWQKAIEAIKEEMNRGSYHLWDSEEVVEIIDKHTKELM